MAITINSEARYLKGIGPKLANTLSRIGIFTIKDLLYYFPREYEDRTKIMQIAELQPEKEALICGKVVSVSRFRTKRDFIIIKAVIQDKSGKVKAIWFNQPFLLKVFMKGIELFLKGKLERNSYSGERTFVPRYYEIKESNNELPIMPVYPLTEGLYQKRLRSMIKNAIQVFLPQIVDYLPEKIRNGYRLQELKDSILKLHYPETIEQAKKAKERLIFDEFFVFQLGILMRKKAFKENLPGISFKVEGNLVDEFFNSLPFKLTASQKKVISDIRSDMSGGSAMNRLIQGDVGCGKTIVAVYAMVVAVQNGYQAAVMAPTEILAIQHYYKISELLHGMNIEIGLLTGSENIADKRTMHKKIASRKPMIVIGTHALLEEAVKFDNLGLAVIDEQHRFGVVQRTGLKSKGSNPDVVVMSATPIPRSLALTLYGDLDCSVITELPPGRGTVTTRFVSKKEKKRMYEFLRKEVKGGRQAYVVYPLVDESEKLDLKAVRTECAKLKVEFPELAVDLIHGRMSGEEKDGIMKRFKEGKIDVLVCTTVIEVGIDVPNATIMIIEHVERFGLSQMHQLRGRIGRGSERSYCFLMGDLSGDAAKVRIKAMLESNDGFYIAEVDLKLRGPGEILGTRQSGVSFAGGLINYRAADIIEQGELLKFTRDAAEKYILEDPELGQEANQRLKQEILDKYGKYLQLGVLN